MDFRTFIVELSYFIAAVLFLVGLRRMSAERTARSGVNWAGWGMIVATLATFFWPGLATANIVLIAGAMVLGGLIAWFPGRKAGLDDMPRMAALYASLGGGAAGAIAATKLYQAEQAGLGVALLTLLGGFLALACFSGSLLGAARLYGWAARPLRFSAQNQVNATVALLALILGLMLLGDYPAHDEMAVTFFVLALVAGVMFTLPVATPDIPVVVCLYNALTGLAVVLVGLVLDNAAMVVAGTLAAAAGGLLTQLSGKAANRSVGRALFTAPAETRPNAGDA